MASELKVDKFTGVTTAGSILVTGEGNSTTTNLQQGLAKMWGKVDQSDGSPAIALFTMLVPLIRLLPLASPLCIIVESLTINIAP